MSNNPQKPNPRVGVGVIIRNNGKVLLLKRKGSHGEGSWAFIGGHLEFGETVEECARRETLEEIGLKLEKVELGPYTQDIFEKEGKHYITLFAITDYNGEKYENLEPEKCTALEWFGWDELPENLFIPVKHLKESGFDPFHM